MMWSILWWFNNMGNGGGGFRAETWPWPAYRGCYPAACTKQDLMINSARLGELYGVAGMSLVGLVEFPEEVPLPLLPQEFTQRSLCLKICPP